MDFPLMIALLALLAWTLLPHLDRYTESDPKIDGPESYLGRLARWINT